MRDPQDAPQVSAARSGPFHRHDRLSRFASTASAGILTAPADELRRRNDHAAVLALATNRGYKLVGNGSFEAGIAGWALAGGAAVVAGNESYKVRAAGDSKSLKLPTGGAARPPFMCVGPNEPSLRLFSKRNSALLGLVSTCRSRSRCRPASASPSGSRCCRATSGQLVHPTAQMPLIGTTCSAAATRRRSGSGSRRCSAAGRSTTCYVDPYPGALPGSGASRT